jgi:hypothetical protein
VTFSCETAGHTVGYTLKATHKIKCGDDGEYPAHDDWPDCDFKCPVPAPEEGYAAQPDEPKAVDVGAEVVFTCLTV